jgi:hypothetical protein
MLPSLGGCRFAPRERADVGEAREDTVFEYHEERGVVWARYAGGDVTLGFLVGTRKGGVEGRLVLSETWRWE